MDLHLSEFCPEPDTWLDPLNAAMGMFDINTAPRIKMFLAQVAHESGGFTALEENLNYSAERLLVIFPRKFTAAESVLYAHQPERIANRAYANMNGNGPESSGHGWLYRGRGLIELTALGNYRRCGAGLGIDLVSAPELLTVPEFAAKSAAWFWSVNGCNELADKDDFAGTTKRVVGGLTGQEDRLSWLYRIEKASA